MRPQVVITGIGMVTPLGADAASTWKSLLRGLSGIGLITKFDAAAFPCRIAGEIKGFDPLPFLTAKETRRVDPFIRYAVAAACMAAADAGLSPGTRHPHRTGVLIGTGRGGVTTMEKNMTALLKKGPGGVSPFHIPMSPVSMASGYVAMKLGVKGPCLTVSTACATGTHAVGEAMKMIQRGDAEIMIAGASEAPITPLVLAGFCRSKTLSLKNDDPDKASRPFDRERDGFVISEGAGVLVLEERGHAERRGARIYAEIAGYGLSSDAFHYTLPDPSGDGSARAMRFALIDAGITPDEVGHVNAHGTSTVPNDRIETRAIKKAFGNHAQRLSISATKSMLGHMLGAAGSVEAAVTALALANGIIPPTINLEHPDPECDLDYVPKVARVLDIGAAISNSLGFGGMNAALVLKRHDHG